MSNPYGEMQPHFRRDVSPEEARRYAETCDSLDAGPACGDCGHGEHRPDECGFFDGVSGCWCGEPA